MCLCVPGIISFGDYIHIHQLANRFGDGSCGKTCQVLQILLGQTSSYVKICHDDGNYWVATDEFERFFCEKFYDLLLYLADLWVKPMGVLGDFVGGHLLHFSFCFSIRNNGLKSLEHSFVSRDNDVEFVEKLANVFVPFFPGKMGVT